MIPEIEQHRAEIEALCRRSGVRHLELFGSAVTGAFRPGESDLDFLVEFADEGPGYFQRYFGLAEGLQALFGTELDLVFDSEIRNPYFRRSVDAARVPLFAS